MATQYSVPPSCVQQSEEPPDAEDPDPPVSPSEVWSIQAESNPALCVVRQQDFQGFRRIPRSTGFSRLREIVLLLCCMYISASFYMVYEALQDLQGSRGGLNKVVNNIYKACKVYNIYEA